MTDGLFKYENQELHEYRCNQNVILDKRFLKYISGFDYVEENANPNNPSNWYPLVNSCYNYAEDYDAVNRVQHLLHEKSIEPYLFASYRFVHESGKDPYTERKTHLKYLKSNPIRFLILGKPCIGDCELGKLLADNWKSVYIEPQSLIEDEIASGSRAGLCIEFNLRCGRAISVDVIMRLLQKKVNSLEALHRGFVICGFPLICNDLFAPDPVSSESAVFNVHEIFDDLVDATLDSILPKEDIKNVSRTSRAESIQDEEQVEEAEDEIKSEKVVKIVVPDEEDLSPLIPSLMSINDARSDICYASNLYSDNINQMNFIFSLFTTNDYILIYLKCPSPDVLSIRENNICDPVSYEIHNLLPEKSERKVFTIFTLYQPREDYENDLHLKYLRLQRDFPIHVRAQLERYRFETETVIEKYIMLHNQQYFIKLDGRIAPHKMFQSLKARLRILPINPSIIPQTLIDEEKEEAGEGGSSVKVDVDYKDQSPEEWFKSMHTKRIAGPLFKWTLSNWGYFCPVAMSRRNFVQGNPKFAIQFMNKIFFLSDEKSLENFTRNPRKYLMPPFPTFQCRIFVVGPKFSGRTAIAMCISYAMNTEILTPEGMIQHYFDKDVNSFFQEAKEEEERKAINIMKQRRREIYEEQEMDRLTSIDEYLVNVKHHINEFIRCHEIVNNFQEVEVTSLPVPKLNEKTSDILEAEDIMNFTTKALSFIGIATDDIEILKEYLQNGLPDFMLPEELQPPLEYKFEMIHKEHPFVIQYVDKAMGQFKKVPKEKDIDMDTLLECYKLSIEKAEANVASNVSNGWVIDGFPLDIDFYDKICQYFKPDLVYLLSDPPQGYYLRKVFKIPERTAFYDFYNFFMENDNQVIASHVPTEALSFCRIIRPNESFGSMFGGYIEHLNDYCEKFGEFIDYLKGQDYFKYKEIVVTDKSIKQIMAEVLGDIQTRFGQQAYVFSEEDRLEEVADFGEPHLEGEELGEGSEFDKSESQNLFAENRRLGDTNVFCPVTLKKHGVLWRGKEEFGAKYLNTIYFFNNEQSMNSFISDPREYSFEKGFPRLQLPPRICVTGIRKIGKTTLARFIARRLGLYYGDFEGLLKLHEGAFDFEAYVQNDEPIDDEILLSILEPFWFQEHRKSTGFVLDGFPRRPSHLEFMVKHSMVPDLIIELTCPEYELNNRLMTVLLNEWQVQMDEEKAVEEVHNHEMMELWRHEREARMKQLLSKKKDERYALHDIEEEDEEEIEGETARSLISIKSVDDAEDIRKVEEFLEAEIPEPVFEDNWETLEMATERLQVALEETNILETNFLTLLHELCDNELIPWVSIDASLSADKVYYQAYRQLDLIKFRTESFLERVYDITVDMADKLLQQGYYFLSRFGKICPVQIYEKFNFIPMYLVDESKFELFPLIYRHHIYFISGSENRKKFKKDVLKYVRQTSTAFKLIPLRIAIIGPPKCGKTTISERLQKEYGFKLISVGEAIRFVLKYMPNCTLALAVEEILRKGQYLSDELAMQCVEAMTFEPRAVAIGMIFDGFPNTMIQVKELAGINLVPHLIVGLESDDDYIYQYMDINPKTHMPEYSKKFIGNRIMHWRKTFSIFDKWIDDEYQNLGKIHVEPSKWHVWDGVNNLFLAIVSEISFYHKYCEKDMALRIANMLVTPLEFLQRKSGFRNYCPCCLFFSNILKCGGCPPDRTGLVQYLDQFYWLCDKHIEEFLDYPLKFLGVNIIHTLPEKLPTPVILEAMPENCYEKGICVVCLEDNKPDRVFVNGSIEFAVEYGDWIYLFDTQECFVKFMSLPSLYFRSKISFLGTDFPSMDIQSLPNLGFLEQFNATQVTKALINTNSLRPLVPGLDIRTSALINIGLQLKLKNPNTPEDYIPRYEEAKLLMKKRRDRLLECLATLKKSLNPLLHYDEPLGPFKMDVFNEQGDSVRGESEKSSESCIHLVLSDILNNIIY